MHSSLKSLERCALRLKLQGGVFGHIQEAQKSCQFSFLFFCSFFQSITSFLTFSSYIAKSNPKGWLPPAVLKLVANSIPLCVAGVRDYLSKFGAPPFVIKLAGEVERSSFEHATSEFSLNFISRPSGFAPVSKIFIPASRYPFGVDVTLKSPSASGKFTKVCLVFCCCLQFC